MTTDHTNPLRSPSPALGGVDPALTPELGGIDPSPTLVQDMGLIYRSIMNQKIVRHREELLKKSQLVEKKPTAELIEKMNRVYQLIIGQKIEQLKNMPPKQDRDVKEDYQAGSSVSARQVAVPERATADDCGCVIG